MTLTPLTFFYIFKFQAVHGAERKEPTSLLFSPQRLSSLFFGDPTQNGSQFNYFLTAPLLVFCQLLGQSLHIDAVS